MRFRRLIQRGDGFGKLRTDLGARFRQHRTAVGEFARRTFGAGQFITGATDIAAGVTDKVARGTALDHTSGNRGFAAGQRFLGLAQHSGGFHRFCVKFGQSVFLL